MALDALLVKCRQVPQQLADALREAGRATGLAFGSITIHAALPGTGTYAYAWLAAPALNANDYLARFSGALQRESALSSVEVEVLPLELLMDLSGASVREAAPFHYVVEAGVHRARERIQCMV